MVKGKSRVPYLHVVEKQKDHWYYHKSNSKDPKAGIFFGGSTQTGGFQSQAAAERAYNSDVNGDAKIMDEYNGVSTLTPIQKAKHYNASHVIVTPFKKAGTVRAKK